MERLSLLQNTFQTKRTQFTKILSCLGDEVIGMANHTSNKTMCARHCLCLVSNACMKSNSKLTQCPRVDGSFIHIPAALRCSQRTSKLHASRVELLSWPLCREETSRSMCPTSVPSPTSGTFSPRHGDQREPCH